MSDLSQQENDWWLWCVKLSSQLEAAFVSAQALAADGYKAET
jgi:hypothetical protein